MIARPATPGKWLDTSWRITPHVAAMLRQVDYLGVFRYVPLPGNPSAGDLSGVEVGCILDAGLELGVVQHVRRPPVLPSAHDGARDAECACEAATACGLPVGLHVFLDLEGYSGSPVEVVRYVDAWGAATKAAGFLAGLYVGYSAILNATELYELPDFDCYWSDAGPRTVAKRGFAIKQKQPEITIAGVSFDPDTVEPDVLGGLPVICAAG